MKRYTLFALILFILVSGQVLAKDKKQVPTQDKTHAEMPSHDGSDRADNRGCRMKGKMLHKMMPKASMVAASDGGLIVLSEGTIYKYDQDLNMVKETALPLKEGAQCPLMKSTNMEVDGETYATPKK